MAKIFPILVLKDNYIWTILNPETNEAAVVDPGEAAPVISLFEKESITLTSILITHHHWDHTGGIAELLSYRNVPVYGPQTEKIVGISNALIAGDVVKLPEQNYEFKVIEVPGHTLGHICFVGKHTLFCGDTLFAGGCGRIFEGSPSQMFNSLEALKKLPPDTKVYCAHEYTENNLKFAKLVEPNNKHLLNRIEKVADLRLDGKVTIPSTIRSELDTNPFLRTDSAELQKNVQMHCGAELNDELEVFTALRKWKDSF